MNRRWNCSLAALLVLTPHALCQEATVKSRIVSVGLFKNGLAVIKREVEISKEGTYRLDASPEPVHGTFWIESNAKAEAAVKMRDVEVPLHPEGGMRLQSDLAGKKVTLHFRNEKMATITGTMVKLAKAPLPEGLEVAERPDVIQQFLVLKTERGRLYINPADVMMVQSDDPEDKITQRKPVLILTVEKLDQKPVLYVSYLTHGMAWAPSYHVDISDPKKLEIEMAAVLRNELADLQDTEIKLISGFPSVEFANVTSPLSAHTSWSKFFQEISARSGGSADQALLNQRVLSNGITTNFDAFSRPRLNLSATPEGEGVDLHFQSIGKRSLLRSEALSLSVGKARADYERVVEWTVGTSHLAHKYTGHPLQQQDEQWDVLHFKNPFPYPMTTAPAMVVENGRFNGQRTSYWSNVGEEANLRITRALSVRAVSREQEDTKANERVVVDDRTYTKIYLKGELVMSNHRKQPIKMHIRHTVRGILHEIEGNPKTSTREGSLEDVNRAHDVLWTLTMAPGEERKLQYKHSVLVLR